MLVLFHCVIQRRDESIYKDSEPQNGDIPIRTHHYERIFKRMDQFNSRWFWIISLENLYITTFAAMGGPFTPACSFLPSRSPMSSALITKLLVGRKKTLNPYLISTFPTPTFFYLSLYDHPNRLYYRCLCRQCHCQPPVSRPVLESIRSTVCTGYLLHLESHA